MRSRRHHRSHAMLVLGIALLALLLLAPKARAGVTPSCIDQPGQVVTITLDITTPPISPGDQFQFGLSSPVGPGAVLATVMHESYTPTGYTATVVFDRIVASGPPVLPADHILNVNLFTARGGVSVIGQLTIGGCAPPAPSIIASGPADGAVDIPRSTGVVVAFDRPMAAESVRRALRLVRAFDGKRVAASVRLVGGGRVAVLRPLHRLAPSRRFIVTVSTAATDVAGIALAARATWSFTTGVRLR